MTFRWGPSHPTGFLTCSERQQLGRASCALVVSVSGCLFSHSLTPLLVHLYVLSLGQETFMVLQEFIRTRPSLQGAHSLAVSQKHTTVVEDDACHSNIVTHVGECYLYTRLSKCFVPANSSYQPRNPTKVVLLFPHFIDQDSEANRRFQGICMGGTKEGFTEEGIHALSLTDICGSGCVWKGWLIPGIPHMKPLTMQPWNHRGPCVILCMRRPDHCTPCMHDLVPQAVTGQREVPADRALHQLI